MAQEYKTLGEFYLAKFINLFTRLDTPEVSEALDGTLARQIAEKMTVLHACLLARRIAELKPSGWAGDGALGAEKLLEKLDEDQVCPAADGTRVRWRHHGDGLRHLDHLIAEHGPWSHGLSLAKCVTEQTRFRSAADL